jgi:hypothetical protein
MNFVFARLCDNDFGTALGDGLSFVMSIDRDFDEKDIKELLIRFVVFRNAVLADPKKTFDSISIRNYLENSLQVTFERHAPSFDHDGGSAVYDRNNYRCWLI